jgi:rhamnopyranosyl-N-acetylglucosaminyl-diphospho-decaprenol beta-1,3/1,4-galactofuranosyltransferase
MNRVCAVLVSRNRKSLLRESLSALAELTRPVQAVVVVDNASTDGTPLMLAREFGHVDVISLQTNAGSAGGYHAGIDWAARKGFDWIWTLDDDSIPHCAALAALLNTRERFSPGRRPELLASKVVWTDGSLHPMNVQKPKLYAPDEQFAAAEHGALSIRFTSFVSMLIHRPLVETYGLPIPGYFLWNDDVEYSARILRREFGVMVPASLVVHKTPEKHVPATSVGGKYFYEIRNKLWIIRHSDAFAPDEKWWMARSLIRRTWRYLRDAGFSRQSATAVARGVAGGLFARSDTTPPQQMSPTAFSREASTIAA